MENDIYKSLFIGCIVGFIFLEWLNHPFLHDFSNSIKLFFDDLTIFVFFGIWGVVFHSQFTKKK